MSDWQNDKMIEYQRQLVENSRELLRRQSAAEWRSQMSDSAAAHAEHQQRLKEYEAEQERKRVREEQRIQREHRKRVAIQGLKECLAWFDGEALGKTWPSKAACAYEAQFYLNRLLGIDSSLLSEEAQFKYGNMKSWMEMYVSFAVPDEVNQVRWALTRAPQEIQYWANECDLHHKLCSAHPDDVCFAPRQRFWGGFSCTILLSILPAAAVVWLFFHWSIPIAVVFVAMAVGAYFVANKTGRWSDSSERSAIKQLLKAIGSRATPEQYVLRRAGARLRSCREAVANMHQLEESLFSVQTRFLGGSQGAKHRVDMPLANVWDNSRELMALSVRSRRGQVCQWLGVFLGLALVVGSLAIFIFWR